MRNMLFKIQWLVTLPIWQKNVTILLDTVDEKTAKDVCNKYHIAIFGIDTFSGTPESFGKAFFRFTFDKLTPTLYSEFDKAKDLYTIFREAWFQIIYINNLLNPLPDTDVARVMEKLVVDYDIAHAARTAKDKNVIEQFTDKVVERGNVELQEVKKLAAKAAEESEKTINDMNEKDKQTVQVLKVRNAVDELKRVKMWSNIIKIRDQMSLVYKLMENIEIQYLEEQKDNELQVLEWSTVTYLDIVSERDKYRKTMALQKAKASWGTWLNYYTIFGTIWLYQKLIWKEIKHKFMNVIIILDGIYNIIIVFIMMTIIWLVLLQLFNTIAYKWTFFTTSFIDIGIMWICSAFLMKFKKPDLINLLIIGPICVIVYFVLRSIIYANFWL